MDEYNKKEPYAEDGSGQTASAKSRPHKSPARPPVRQLPPWKVILHNDDLNDLNEVVQIIYTLTPLKKEQALACTVEAHTSGAAMLLTTHQERAELYVEQFASSRLTVTAEPAK